MVPDREAETGRPISTARYLPGDEIARGGMGRVALATDTLLERVVAVKQALTLDPEMLRRFARETKITARLEHPSIVPVYDAGTDGDAPFYVMRRVEGQPLSDLIMAHPSLDARLALVPNLLAAAQAVAHAHSRGIVHRDIKPSNILVGEHGETVVIDWGLAKVVGEPDDEDALEISAGDSLRTRAGTVFGTPGFMSPRQLRGEPVDFAADVYALGASLYFMLSGKPPHHAPTGDAMMVLAAEGPPELLSMLVPGVPRELATIVDTALGYGGKHYRDASSFVEDLRRFSTGQLVAAHRYSSTERVRRFARKYRAALAIAVVALIVIAVGATLSIQRVLEERDRADSKARDAELSRQAERERADQLLLLRARMLVDTNPTEAVALLKEIDPTSRRLAEAHGVASAAIMRGVPRGLPGSDVVLTLTELDPTGALLLQITRTGELRVIELERGETLLAERFKPGLRAIWIGDRVLLYGSVSPTWIDPITKARTKLALPSLRDVKSSDDQTTLVGELEDGELIRFDREGRMTRVWPGHRVLASAIAGTGAWCAASDGKELVVFARDGTEIARHEGDFQILQASKTNKLAALATQESPILYELEVGPKPTWSLVDTARFHRIVMMVMYRGDELMIGMGSGHVLAYRDHGVVELARPLGGLSLAREFGDDELVLLAGSSLLYFNRFGSRVIPLPQQLTTPRFAGRRGVDHLVVSSTELSLVYAFASYGPRALPVRRFSQVDLLDEHTLIVASSEHELSWLDLESGRQTKVGRWQPAVRRIYDVTGELVLMHVFHGTSSQLYQLRKNTTELTLLYEGPPISVFGRLTDGTVIYAAGSRLSMVLKEGRSSEILKLEGPLRSLIPIGTSFVAMSVSGEVVRGDVSGIQTRIQLPTPPPRLSTNFGGRPILPSLDLSEDHEIIVGWGTTVWKWTDKLVPLLTVETPLIDLVAVGREVFVVTLGRRSMLVDRATGERHGLPSHGEHVIFARAKRNTFTVDVNGWYHFVDPVSHTTWPTLIRRDAVPPQLSESGKRLILHNGGDWMMWNLPGGSGAIRPRLDAVSNAKVNGEGLLSWPWMK